MRNKNNLIIPFEVFLEFSNLYREDLTFIVFIQKFKYNSLILTVDSKQHLRGFDKNFSKLLTKEESGNEYTLKHDF